MKAKDWIDRLGMRRHPEGGWFAELWKSAMMIETPRGKRHAATAIHFLLEAGDESRWHRLQSDETWHFIGGGQIEIFEMDESGNLLVTELGPERPFHVVPAGRWFGSRPAQASGFSIVTCVVAPGFDYADFELADAERFPSLRAGSGTSDR